MPEVAHIEPGPDTFKILLTTDNHVGYMENDKVRGDDSWKTFAEILKIGREQDVDMIVQGGDLFHINAPTKKSYYHVMRALREYCWCDKPIEYRLVSDPSDAMATKHFVYPAEYDLNVNVGMPLYAISGNHDDATGEELLSPLDILSVSGLINHFGRVIDNEQITVCPLLFNKGKTNMALYGLHSVREERLMKTMASGNLEFLEPDTKENGSGGFSEEIDDENAVHWFNLMCIHQNHVHRPGVKVFEETCLPTFLDFVLWGHEHDCRPVAVQNDITGTYILQAGSSIATSLSEGETLDKHVYVLSVKGKDFSLQPIKLKTVRPFVMKDIILSKSGLSATSSNKKEVLNYLMIEVELMIENANNLWRENNKDLFEDEIFTESDIPLPLIRLRVEYSGGYEVENPRFFSNRFVGKVANINDVVLFYKKKRYDKSSTKLLISGDEMMSNGNEEDTSLNFETEEFKEEDTNILDLITEKLEDTDLIMLTKKKVSAALSTLVAHEEDKHILSKFIQNEEEEHIEMLQEMTLDDDDESLRVSEKVNDVKKSFRELAKRIKAETRYQTKPLETVSGVDSGPLGGGPIMYNASLGTNIVATSTQNDEVNKGSGKVTSISRGGVKRKTKPALSQYKNVKSAKSDEFVVDTSEDEPLVEPERVAVQAAAGSTFSESKKRTRPSALDTIFDL